MFVTFFGGVVGAAAAAELGLQPGQTAQDVFSVGQVVKATVLAAAKGKLKLSLAPKAQAEAAAAAAVAAPAAPAAPAAGAAGGAASGGADALGGLQPGDVAEATVVEVQASGEAAAGAAGGVSYVLRLDVAGGPAGGVRGRLEAAHLSDHPAAVEGFKEAIKPGSKLGELNMRWVASVVGVVGVVGVGADGGRRMGVRCCQRLGECDTVCRPRHI